MTQRREEDLSKLERVLAEAHRTRPEPSLGADWVNNVMGDIRRVAAEDQRQRNGAGVERLVWQTAAAAAALALVFAASVSSYTSDDTVELSALLSQEFENGESLVE